MIRPATFSLLVMVASAAAQPPLAYMIDSDLDNLYEVGNQGQALLVGSTAGGGLTDPAGLAWRLDTRTLWTVDFAGGEVGTLNRSTGAFSHVFTASPTTGWQGIDYDPTAGIFWLINGDFNLYRLDPATGLTTRVGATGAPLMTALESDANGVLWGIGFANGILYRIDKTTGVATPTVTTTPVNMQGLSFGPDGRLFATNSTTDSLYLINTSTGATTLTGAHGGGVRFVKGFEITYTLAAAELSGAGCPTGAAVSFYELFAPGAFDLANARIRFTPVGPGYRVEQGTGVFVPPASANLGLADDAVSAPLNLPFSFAFPGGTTSQIRICSNGFIHLSGTATSTDFTPTVNELLSGGPRLLPLWMDLNPSVGGGGVFFDVVGSRVRITWLNVLEFGGTNPSTVQVELDAAGVVEYRWLAAGNVGTGHNCLVGFSPGNANRDPGNRDLSVALPFLTQADVFPLEQTSGRPVIGTAFDLLVRNIPAASVAGFEAFGVPVPGAGISLSSLGMPGCSQYLQPVDVALPFVIGAPTATVRLTVPNDSNLVGWRLGAHAVVLKPGINAAGVVTSNLVTLVLGEL